MRPVPALQHTHWTGWKLEASPISTKTLLKKHKVGKHFIGIQYIPIRLFGFLALAKGTYVVNLACVCVHLWHLLRYTVTQEGKVGLKSHLVYRCAIVGRCALLFLGHVKVTKGQLGAKTENIKQSNNSHWQGLKQGWGIYSNKTDMSS